MNGAGGIAAVVLAAGMSSRMGETKSLLPLGAVPVIERVVGAVSRAEVGDIIVVTGHDSETIALVLERLAVRRAHNAGHEAGMFSSVRIGARALRDDVEAFFILPVDYPLVRSEVLDLLAGSFRQGGPGILHPTCCGLRGHPPLISGRYRESLLQMDDADDLRSFLRRHADDEGEIDVEDLTILADMDTSEDYQRMRRFAGLLDAAKNAPALPPAGSHASLSTEDSLYLLALLEASEEVVQHCWTVADVGTVLAEALKPRLPSLDVDLVRCACLLHDMARARPKHAVVAQNILTNLGLPRLGEIVGAHMVMPAERLETHLVTEEELVYLADKWVVEDQIVGLGEREARALRRTGQDSAALAGVRARMQTAQVVRQRVECALGGPLEEVLRRERRSSI